MEPLTPTQNSLSTQTTIVDLNNAIAKHTFEVESMYPISSPQNLSTGVKILSVFKKADRWIAIFVAKLLPYV